MGLKYCFVNKALYIGDYTGTIYQYKLDIEIIELNNK